MKITYPSHQRFGSNLLELGLLSLTLILAPTVIKAQQDETIVIVSKGTCADHGFRIERECTEAASAFELTYIENFRVNSSQASCRIVNMSENEPVLLQDLDPSPCTEESPCVCRADKLKPLEVCESGVFDPDPLTYYTIASHSGNLLGNERIFMNRFGLKDITESKVQWRFIPDHDTGTWIIRSRSSGLDMSDNGSTFDIGLGDAFSRLRFDPVCVNGGVDLLSESKTIAPRDCCSKPFTLSTTNDVKMNGDASASSITKQSGCVKKRRSCTSMFGEGFKQVSRTLCTFGTTHALKCRKEIPMPPMGTIRTMWNVTEVQSFTPAKVSENDLLEPLESTFNAEDFISDNLAGSLVEGGVFGAIAGVGGVLATSSVGLPFISAAFLTISTVGGSVLFNLGPDPIEVLAERIGEALDQFAKDVDDKISSSIADAQARDDAEQINRAAATQRRWFLTLYPELKRLSFEGNDLDSIEDLSDILLHKAQLLESRIEELIGSENKATEVNARRFHASFRVLKLAIAELLNMVQEVVLLKSYGLPHFDCETILRVSDVQNMSGRLTDTLVNGQQALIGFYSSTVGDSFFDAFRRDEAIFDIQHFSFPIKDIVKTMEQYSQATLRKCELLRSDESFRAAFEKDVYVTINE